jgi:hypothetical protein
MLKNFIFPIVVAGGFLLGISTPASSSEPPTAVIPTEIYQAAGLDKLTEVERRVLLEWLASRGITGEISVVTDAVAAATAAAIAPAPAVAPAASAMTVMPAPAPSPADDFRGPNEIRTRIVSPFTGWTGKTVFTMENGQVWQQRMEGSYQFKGTDTRVVIRKGSFGHDRMRLESTGRWIGVTRIK